MYFHNDHNDHDMWLTDWNKIQTKEEPPMLIHYHFKEIMEDRWAFCQAFGKETLQHQQIQQHGGMGETWRNIALVLRDQEQRGVERCIM